MKSPRSPAGQIAQRPRAFAVKAGGVQLDSVQEHSDVVEQAAFGELLSYSLERLSKEPELLKAEREQLHRYGQVSFYPGSLVKCTHYVASLQQG